MAPPPQLLYSVELCEQEVKVQSRMVVVTRLDSSEQSTPPPHFTAAQLVNLQFDIVPGAFQVAAPPPVPD